MHLNRRAPTSLRQLFRFCNFLIGVYMGPRAPCLIPTHWSWLSLTGVLCHRDCQSRELLVVICGNLSPNKSNVTSSCLKDHSRSSFCSPLCMEVDSHKISENHEWTRDTERNFCSAGASEWNIHCWNSIARTSSVASWLSSPEFLWFLEYMLGRTRCPAFEMSLGCLKCFKSWDSEAKWPKPW